MLSIEIVTFLVILFTLFGPRNAEFCLSKRTKEGVLKFAAGQIIEEDVAQPAAVVSYGSFLYSKDLYLFY